MVIDYSHIMTVFRRMYNPVYFLHFAGLYAFANLP